MTKNVDMNWLQWNKTSQLRPPKNEWVLMTHGNYCSMGRWLGDTWYEFFDTYTNEIISIATPIQWARMPQMTIAKTEPKKSQKHEYMPTLGIFDRGDNEENTQSIPTIEHFDLCENNSNPRKSGLLS